MSAKLSVNLLLRANFSRLWRSASFWVALVSCSAPAYLNWQWG